jgi:hypothetical protein
MLRVMKAPAGLAQVLSSSEPLLVARLPRLIEADSTPSGLILATGSLDGTDESSIAGVYIAVGAIVQLARDNNLGRIALPLLGTGAGALSKAEALDRTLEAIGDSAAGDLQIGLVTDEPDTAEMMERVLATRGGPTPNMPVTLNTPDMSDLPDPVKAPNLYAARVTKTASEPPTKETAKAPPSQTPTKEAPPRAGVLVLGDFSSGSEQVLARAEALRIDGREPVLRLEHLVAGLFLYAQTQARFRAAQITAAELIARGVPLPTRSASPMLPLREMPPLSDEVRAVIAEAAGIARAKGHSIRSRHLLAGVLAVDSDLSRWLRARGINAGDETDGPAPPPPSGWLAGYASDRAEGDDSLDLTSEIAALSSLLIAKSVEPPLSVGLFGEWGSGKSFFMKQMESWIKERALLSRDAPDSKFCSNVVQITFNAWYYVDANLWASLVTRLFDESSAPAPTCAPSWPSSRRRARCASSSTASCRTRSDGRPRPRRSSRRRGRGTPSSASASRVAWRRRSSRWPRTSRWPRPSTASPGRWGSRAPAWPSW